jgi:hypothetical protein
MKDNKPNSCALSRCTRRGPRDVSNRTVDLTFVLDGLISSIGEIPAQVSINCRSEEDGGQKHRFHVYCVDAEALKSIMTR